MKGYDDYNGEDVGGDLARLYENDNDMESEPNVASLPKTGKDYYIITCQSPYTGNILYYLDRTKQKKQFWSESSEDVFQFWSKTAAIKYWKRLQYNHPQVWLVKSETGVTILIKG